MTDKMTDKSEQRIFSYLRKSTNKGDQEASIERQKKYVEGMAKKFQLDADKIEYFIDSGKSGFRGSEYKDSKSEDIVRKREGYGGMLTEIRKQKTPCKILSWTVSRIARDSKEGSAIHNLLGNNQKREKKIEIVHFLDGSLWDEYTPQSKIYNDIGREEESSREKSIWKSERKKQALDEGLYPNEFKVPKGLKNTGVGVKANGIAGGKLKELDEMSSVKKAFEMKAEGSSNKDIHNYLKRKGVSVYIGKIAETIFSNTVYNGYYTDKETGEVFDLKYSSGRKPISNALFNKAQAAISRKSGKYGDKQKFDLLANLLRTSTGRRLSVYTPKNRTAKQYQNATEKIYTSQNKIFTEFEEIIKRFYYLSYCIQQSIEYSKIIEGDEELANTVKLVKSYEDFTQPENLNVFMRLNNIMHDIMENGVGDSTYESLADTFPEVSRDEILKWDAYSFNAVFLNRNKSSEETYISIKNIILENGDKELFEQEEENKSDIEDLKREKNDIGLSITKAKKNAILNGFSKKDVEDATEELTQRMNEIDDDIQNLKNNSISDQDLDKFIEALQNIFEHISSMHIKGMNGVSEEDMLHLIKLTTFELKIKPSKELDIGLFEGLKKVLYGIGIPTENGTPVSALRRPHPNH